MAPVYTFRKFPFFLGFFLCTGRTASMHPRMLTYAEANVRSVGCFLKFSLQPLYDTPGKSPAESALIVFPTFYSAPCVCWSAPESASGRKVCCFLLRASVIFQEVSMCVFLCPFLSIPPRISIRRRLNATVKSPVDVFDFVSARLKANVGKSSSPRRFREVKW